jgi:hypothetical protein
MKAISRIARADLPRTPQVEPLSMPRGVPTIPRLAAAADGMAKAAAPFASVFTAAGLPDDFIARLNSAVDALVASNKDRMQSRGKRSGATQGLKSRLVEGRRIVNVLDALVTTTLKDDPVLLGSWNTVKRVQKSGGGRTPAAVTSGGTQAPAPAPTPGSTGSTLGSIPTPQAAPVSALTSTGAP